MVEDTGYHSKNGITRGTYGEFSKVDEEFEELRYARAQQNKPMEIMEIADLLGALNGYLEKKYKGTINIYDAIKMMEATKKAFENGKRR